MPRAAHQNRVWTNCFGSLREPNCQLNPKHDFPRIRKYRSAFMNPGIIVNLNDELKVVPCYSKALFSQRGSHLIKENPSHRLSLFCKILVIDMD